MSEIQKDLERYFSFMMSGNIDGCIAIENKYDLFGFTPEEVTSALAAAAQQGSHPTAAGGSTSGNNSESGGG